MRSEEYFRPLKTFLNDYLGDYRDLTKLNVSELRRLFIQATRSLAATGARRHLRRSGQRVNAALLEAVVVAAMRRVAAGKGMEPEQISQALQTLIDKPELGPAIAGSTATEDKLKTRLDLATASFMGDAIE